MRLVQRTFATAFLVALFASAFCPLAFAVSDPDIINAQALDATQSAHAYVIGPQNVVQIKVFGDASTNQIYRVDESGKIKHAILGSIQIGGLTVAAAEKLIETALSGDYFVDPRVTVFVLEHSRFSVIGEVRKPGTYEILGKTSIIEAISMAGGFTPVANQSGVKIIRKKEGRESTVQVDVKRITNDGSANANIYIDADDVVVIPKSFF